MADTQERSKRSTCPEWCVGHAEWDSEPGGHDGPFSTVIPSDLGGRHAVEVLVGSDEVTGVSVQLNSPGGTLTAGQAREAALALLKAADWVDANL